MFYLEEKSLTLSPEMLAPKILRALVHQHDRLLEACKIVENCKEMRTCAKLRKFQDLLKVHFEFEEKFINRFIPANKISPSSKLKSPNLGFYPLEELRKYNKKLMKTRSNTRMNERNTMKALTKIHVKKLLSSLLRAQKPISPNPSLK